MQRLGSGHQGETVPRVSGWVADNVAATTGVLLLAAYPCHEHSTSKILWSNFHPSIAIKSTFTLKNIYQIWLIYSLVLLVLVVLCWTWLRLLTWWLLFPRLWRRDLGCYKFHVIWLQIKSQSKICKFIKLVKSQLTRTEYRSDDVLLIARRAFQLAWLVLLLMLAKEIGSCVGRTG